MRVIPPRTLVLYCLLIMLVAVPSHGAGKPRIAAPNAPPTFNATITPNPLTLPGPPGNSKQVTVTTTVDPAFGAVIVYSFSGFPNFITNDGPKSANPNNNYAPIVFNFTLGVGASPGTYNGTLNADTGANGVKQFPFTVIVPQTDIPASFTQPAVTLCNGGATVGDSIQLAPANGYSGVPTVKFISIPPGITVNPPSFSGAQMPPAQTLPFTISASGAATGSQLVVANVSDPAANINKNISLQINVVDPNFTPFANPSSLTVTAGGGAQSVNVSITTNGCFNGGVTVTASGMPAGMTVTPNPASTSGPAVPMAIQASAATTPGSYPITLTYAAGNLVKTLTIDVTVNAAPDFDIKVNPSTLTVQPGATASVQVTVTGINNFNGAVSITAPSTPDVIFSPATFTLSPGGSQTVTLTIGASATPGTRPLQFTGTSPAVSGTRSAPLVLIISNAPDFTLNATPPTLTVASGSSGTVTVTATALSGFNGTVTVNAPNVPGLTITPQTFTLTPGGAGQQVTIAVGTSTPQTIPLTFVGFAGGVPGERTATVQLIVVTPPDFRLTVTPDSLAIAGGGITTVAVGITALNGFNGVVNITAPQIPGVTFTPSTFTLAPGASQNINVNVAPGTAANILTGTFTGIAPGIASPRSALITIHVTQRPDFTISAAPPALSIRAGGDGVVTITATGVNGFSGPILVTASVNPNLTITPSTFTILPGASQQVTIHALQPAQPKLVIFTAAANGIEHQASVNVTVLPRAPILVAAAPSAVVAGASSRVVRVSGDFFQPGAVFSSSDPSLIVDGATILTPQLADVTLTVRGDAKPGARNLNVTNPDGGTSSTPLVILVYPTSSIAAPLDVTAAAIIFPARGTMIAPKEALYPRGLLATAGTGTIIGSWQFDGVPFDRFIVNAAGGMPVEVKTNVPVPTSFTGSHTLELVIESPRHIVSPVIEVIDAIDRVSRLTLLAPRDGAVIDPRQQLFRWSLLPNCSGFDVEVDVAQTLLSVPSVPHSFRVSDAQWRPSKDDLASIGPGIHRWRVRPHCAGDTTLEPSEWQRFAVLPEHVDITLSPIANRTIRWTSGVDGLLYRVEFLAPDGSTIFAALTSKTEYIAPASVPIGTTVRVVALAPNGSILGTSASSPLARHKGREGIQLVQQVTVIEFGPVEPADGATVQNPQPRITAQWKGAAKADQIMLLVDNTDITAVATVTPTSISYDSLIALAPGVHSVALAVAGNINRWTFSEEIPGATPEAPAAPAVTPRGDWVIAPVGTITLVRDSTNEAHTQLSALTDLNFKSNSITTKATGDVGLKHDFDQDKTIQESRNWLTDVGVHQGPNVSEAVRIGFAQPDFFDQAQLVTLGLPHGGIQAKVVMPGGVASYYQTFTSRPAGVVSGLFGPEQKLKAAAFQIPYNMRWDFRVLALKVEDAPSFTSDGGEGKAIGIFARYSIGSTLNAIFEGARGDFKPAFGSFDLPHRGNAYRIGLTGMRGTFNYAFNIRRTESEFVNPANRGFTPGGVPDRTGADLTLGKFIGTTSITVQLRHLQDGSADGLFVPRTRQTGGLVSIVKMLGSHVSLAFSGNLTKDKGEEKPEIFLPRADRSQSGGTGTLSEFFGRFNFSQTLSRQLLRDRVNSLNDQTITSGTVTGGGMFNPYFNLAAVLSGTRSEGSFIVGVTNQYLASLQPTFSLPRLYLSLQPRASYSTSKNDLYESKSTTEQYQGLLTFAPPWLGSIVALQLSADWTKNSFAGQLDPAKFVHRYVGTINFHWRAGMGPAYTNYVPFTAPGAPANPGVGAPGVH